MLGRLDTHVFQKMINHSFTASSLLVVPHKVSHTFLEPRSIEARQTWSTMDMKDRGRLGAFESYVITPVRLYVFLQWIALPGPALDHLLQHFHRERHDRVVLGHELEGGNVRPQETSTAFEGCTYEHQDSRYADTVVVHHNHCITVPLDSPVRHMIAPAALIKLRSPC
ncbi:hypothetical protein K503DRAFT_354144 [Rhizopogon vinicolor AM-OR11-026]|uniref:Uncharacterized protein n=1 Tax=Rhizopogon vinicolor AM-OR11-026 TaxID=1314800 RepID=A0A1B7NC25_9AGAM|nr:hypothetical protein K503DRAFT_354144 [Rhizopogon vinicolor AM-OR11-026]